MIKLFQNRPAKWCATALCSVLMITACSTEESVAPDTGYTGEEIFRGIFFWDGRLATEMEILKPGAEQLSQGMNNEQLLTYTEFTNEIVREVNALDPAYFANFKKNMQSDNLYEIELALTNAQSMFEAAGKRSSYAEHFHLLTEIKDKNVDVNSDKFKNLDLTNSKDAETFAKIFREDYGIDIEGMNSLAGRGHCVAITFFIAGNVALVVNLAGAWNVYYSSNFTRTQNYQIPRFSSTDATSKALVSELAALIN